MKQLKNKLFALIITAVFFAHCKPESPAIPASQKSSIAISFNHYIADSLLVLNTKNYSNSIEQNFTVDKFNYFISWIIFGYFLKKSFIFVV
jgi:hypothetical protein